MKEILHFLKRIAIRIGYFVLGGLLAIALVFPDHMEVYNDYQIVYQGFSGNPTTIYARGERKGLLGQHEAIVLSPENIASRKWSFDPSRDLRYEGEDYVLYKIEKGALHVYSKRVVPNIDYSQWTIPLRQETFKMTQKFLVQENSRKNGYNIISVRDMTE